MYSKLFLTRCQSFQTDTPKVAYKLFFASFEIYVFILQMSNLSYIVPNKVGFDCSLHPQRVVHKFLVEQGAWQTCIVRTDASGAFHQPEEPWTELSFVLLTAISSCLYLFSECFSLPRYSSKTPRNKVDPKDSVHHFLRLQKRYSRSSISQHRRRSA